MGSLNPEERKNFAKELNTIKDQLTSKIEKKFKDFEDRLLFLRSQSLH